MAVSRRQQAKRAARVACCTWTFLACVAAAGAADARGAAVDAATPQQQKDAQSLYERGVQRFKAGRFAEAARSFASSYEIVSSPNSHIMYARALREAGELNQAYEELALTQVEASELAARLPKYASTAEAAEAELAELGKRVAALSIRVSGTPGDAKVSVGDRQLPRERWLHVAVSPGPVAVSAVLPDGRRTTQPVKARVGQRIEVNLAFADAAQPVAGDAGQTGPVLGPVDSDHDRGTSSKPSLRPWAYVAGGIGAAGLVTFGVFGAMSRSTYSDLEDRCPGGDCPSGSQDDIDRGKSQQRIANIGLAIGVIGVATGVTLFVIDTSQHSGKSDSTNVALGVGPGSLQLEGSFR